MAGCLWLLSVELVGQWLLAGLAEPAGLMSWEQREMGPIGLLAATVVPLKSGSAS